MKRILDYFRLLGIRCLVAYRNLVEWVKVVFFYYRKWTFGKLDWYLLRCYLLENPYRISKRFLLEKGEEKIYTYGETPLTTLEQIVKECEIHSNDVVYELGSGRGRTCFWLHFFVECKVVGIEYVPEFVRISLHVREHFRVKNVKFMFQNFLDADFSEATVIYFYGTCTDTQLLQQLIDKVKTLPARTRIITVSYPLADAVDQQIFRLIKSFPAQFTWGITQVYLQEIVDQEA